MSAKLKYFIIDGSAPFFACAGFSPGETVNWSKIPFAHLERNDILDEAKAAEIAGQFDCYARRVAGIGYNYIALDDVAHLVAYDFYPPALNARISSYQKLFAKLFDIAALHGLKILITTDIMFSNIYIEEYSRGEDMRLMHALVIGIRRLFKHFPQIRGVIMRLGESDGMDVQNDFRSRLVIRTPSQCRRYMQNLLPVFERHNRVLIIRTWSLGAYQVGDLMWNPQTYQKAFGDIVSRHFIVSHKFGDTDFYRFLKLNPLFYEGHHKKIVELQARREYEGFGEFPSFTGFDYEEYCRKLDACEDLAGISVWCQTGGWSRFQKPSFLPGASIYNEINSYVTVKVFREQCSAEDALYAYSRQRFPRKDPEILLRLMSASDMLMKKLWYIPEYSSKRLYFRRVRVPPLIWIFWDTIVINHMLRKILRRFVHRRREAVREGYQALYKARYMRELAAQLQLDTDAFDFQYETLKIIALSREYFFGHWNAELGRRIEHAVQTYTQRYPRGFAVEYDFSPTRIKKQLIKALFRICLRPHAHYRLADWLFIIRLTGWIYPLVKIWEKRRMPQFTQKQAMGIQVLFK